MTRLDLCRAKFDSYSELRHNTRMAIDGVISTAPFMGGTTIRSVIDSTVGYLVCQTDEITAARYMEEVARRLRSGERFEF